MRSAVKSSTAESNQCSRVNWVCYGRATRNKGCPLANCVGFIDGRVRPTCRPKYFRMGIRTAFMGIKLIPTDLIVPYKGNLLTRDQKRLNNAMKAFMISVEWEFRVVTDLFKFLDYKHGLKLLVSCGDRRMD